MLNLGARMGEVTGRIGYHKFYTRSLGYMVSELNEHREKEEIELLMAKVKLLSENWDTVGKSDEFRIFRGEFDAIPDSESKADPDEIVNASSAAGLPENHLHD